MRGCGNEKEELWKEECGVVDLVGERNLVVDLEGKRPSVWIRGRVWQKACFGIEAGNTLCGSGTGILT